jgi:hypothetical protein
LTADSDLVERAKKKAGGNARLAAIFGVDESASSRWGQTRKIPRHLRPRVEAYVAVGEITEEPLTPPPAKPGNELAEQINELGRRMDEHLGRQVNLLTDVRSLLRTLAADSTKLRKERKRRERGAG